jgi:MFS family permease
MQTLIGATAAMVIAGVGFGALLGAPTRYIVTREVDERGRATAVGLLSIFLIIGQIVGAGLAGGIAGSHPGQTGFVHVYVTLAIVAVASLALTSLLKPRSVEVRSSAITSAVPL